MIKWLSYFSYKLPAYLVYMAQQVEYDPVKLLEWLNRHPNLFWIMRRGTLKMTKKAAALTLFQYICVFIFLILTGFIGAKISLIFIILILFVPIISIISLFLAIYGGRVISLPMNMLSIKKSRVAFAAHPGLKVAILGSFGKTTMKELLLTVLSEAKNVRATPGNKNVPISHARWAKTLKGNEDVLLIEFGEGKPGDIAAFCQNTSPKVAVLTGIAANHLDKYSNLEALAEDLSSVAKFVGPKNIYVNTQAQSIMGSKSVAGYSQKGTGKVKISDVKVTLQGMDFSARIGTRTLKLHTGLVGRHLVGPLAVCILLADQLGLSDKQIVAGIKKTAPFEHRMQPRELHGAWIIDDTYNGSLEGFRGGLELLKELKAKRKIYVTPGLVDQGEETERVHHEIGELIAAAKPDKVVLIKNSVTEYIHRALSAKGYKGEVEIREDALEFYTNLEHILAAGDVVLLQNDWTDNYY